MVDPPWDLLLTVAFVLTGTSGIWTLVVCPGSGGQTVLRLNHTAMSAAMILMIWVIVRDVAIWAQVALFAILTLALLPGLRGTSGTSSPSRRADVVGHLGLNAAMIWMLAAMPLLMTDAHATGTHTAGHAGHSGAAAALPAAGAAAAPGWAIVVNSLFIMACGAGVVWWLLRAAVVREHRLPALGHGLMATGMGTMLLLMAG